MGDWVGILGNRKIAILDVAIATDIDIAFHRIEIPDVLGSPPNRVTPFDVGTLYIVSCRNRVLFSDSKNNDGNCDSSAFNANGTLVATDKKLGEYLVRGNSRK